jgi:uncharacterized protein HemX
MKPANSASLQRFSIGVGIIIAIGGLGWSGHSWLNGKFTDFNQAVAALKESNVAAQTEQSKDVAIKLAAMQRQIDALTSTSQRKTDQIDAAIKVMNVNQPKPTRELVRDLMVNKGMPQSASSRRPGWGDKGISASATVVKK